MELRAKYLSLLFVIITSLCFAQDKLFLKNGTKLNCKLVAIAKNTITYRDSINNLKTVLKSDAIIAEYATGEVYIFSGEKIVTENDTSTKPLTNKEVNELLFKEWKKKEKTWGNSIIGCCPFQLFVGRATVSYEYLFSEKSIGVLIPFSLTFNPYSGNNSSSGSSSNNSNIRPSGTGLISGFDVNYYYDIEDGLKYYFGPRVRYGTDVLLGSIEGLTVQLQNGIMICESEEFVANAGMGVGFFKLSEKYSNWAGYEPNQVYPWMSFTLRIGYRFKR